MSMRHLALVLNPTAAQDEVLREAILLVEARGHRLTLLTPQEPGTAWKLAAEAARAGVDGIVAAGGDGTLNEVVNGAVEGGQGKCAVGVLPFGTANDFAAAAGLAGRAPLEILLLAAEGTPIPIDVGKANDRLFINVASGGLGAEVTASTPRPLKDLLGGLAYTLTGLVKLFEDSHAVRVRARDWEWRGPLLYLAVGNGKLAGGGYAVAPQAVLNDGLLDVAVIPAVDLADMPELLGELFDENVLSLRHIHYRQVPWVEIEALDRGGPGLHVNLDGEPVQAASFRFELLDTRLPFFLPPAPAGEEAGGEMPG